MWIGAFRADFTLSRVQTNKVGFKNNSVRGTAQLDSYGSGLGFADRNRTKARKNRPSPIARRQDWRRRSGTSTLHSMTSDVRTWCGRSLLLLSWHQRESSGLRSKLRLIG